MVSETLSAQRRWTILAVCTLSLLVVGLDTTIVTVALPKIGIGLHVSNGRIAWVIDAYMVPFASLLITAGALADRFGRRRVFQTGLVIFGVSSLAGSAAPSFELLIAARAIQGIGASMLTPIALAIVVNVMADPKERAQATGIWGAMFGLSMAIGPITGGALIAAFDWRSVFWVNGPVVVIAFILVMVLVPESKAGKPRQLDPMGQILIVVTLAIVVAILIEGGRIGWISPVMISAYVLLLVILMSFVWFESRSREPLVDPALFRNAGLTGSVISAIMVFVSFSMTLLLTTLLLQDGLGWAPFAAGAMTLPMAIGTLVCAPGSGYLVGRIGPRVPLLISGACLLLGGMLLISLIVAVNIWILFGAYLLIGSGVGLSSAPITDTSVDSLPLERAGVAGGITSTSRQIGTTLGAALVGTLDVSTHTSSQTDNSLSGWIIITICGALVIGTAMFMPNCRPDKRIIESVDF